MKYLIQLFCTVVVACLITACGSKDKSYADRMANQHKDDQPVQNESVAYKQVQPVQTKTVSYAKTDSGAIKGFLAMPQNADEELPGLIVIHEWWGLNDNVRMMTKRLAGHGYTALAVDLYHGQVAQTPEKAKEYLQQVLADPEGAINNLKQAYQYLSEETGAKNVGVIGWCFGGGWSLETALALPDKIDATVIYYGRLVTDMQQLRTLEMPILAFFGGQDDSIPAEAIKTFEKNLKLIGKEPQIYIYEKANHAFANPSGRRYNKKAAQDAWQKTIVFLEQALK